MEGFMMGSRMANVFCRDRTIRPRSLAVDWI